MPADADLGMAFVLVQHLAPDHESLLTELIRRYTRMQVFEVEDGMAVRPNCVYIIQRSNAHHDQRVIIIIILCEIIIAFITNGRHLILRTSLAITSSTIIIIIIIDVDGY